MIELPRFAACPSEIVMRWRVASVWCDIVVCAPTCPDADAGVDAADAADGG